MENKNEKMRELTDKVISVGRELADDESPNDGIIYISQINDGTEENPDTKMSGCITGAPKTLLYMLSEMAQKDDMLLSAMKVLMSFIGAKHPKHDELFKMLDEVVPSNMEKFIGSLAAGFAKEGKPIQPESKKTRWGL